MIYLRPTQSRTILIGLALIALALSGCSRVKLGYNSADFLIERYADDYLSLDSDQMAAWKPRLKQALARHRSEELPYLAAFFEATYKESQRGFDKVGVACLLDQFEDVYRRNAIMAAALAAPVLTDLAPQQIRHLQRKFRKDEADDAEDAAASPQRRALKRAIRYAKSAEWWIGSLSKEQQGTILDVTARMPDTTEPWEAYTRAKRNGLIRLLEQHASAAEIRRFLTSWLADFQDLPPELAQARLDLRRSIAELFVRLGASLSPEQHAHLNDRLRGLRDDFMDLQRHPRMPSSRCLRHSAATSQL
jgi:hypothetical protein